MDDRVGVLESVVNLMILDNVFLKLKVSYGEIVNKVVICGFLVFW